MPPLVIYVQDIEEEGLSLDLAIDDVPPSTDVKRGDLAIVGKVHLRAVAYRSGRDVFLRGEIEALLSLLCARCLEDFRHPLKIDIKTNYLYGKEEGGEEEVLEEMMDQDTCYYRGDTINITDEVMSQIQLAVPMKPLCGEGCLGLCPRCGTNLNRNKCSCDVIETDPRFAILKNLRLK